MKEALSGIRYEVSGIRYQVSATSVFSRKNLTQFLYSKEIQQMPGFIFLTPDT
jgi:hypothetical protein